MGLYDRAIRLRSLLRSVYDLLTLYRVLRRDTYWIRISMYLQNLFGCSFKLCQERYVFVSKLDTRCGEPASSEYLSIRKLFQQAWPSQAERMKYHFPRMAEKDLVEA